MWIFWICNKVQSNDKKFFSSRLKGEHPKWVMTPIVKYEVSTCKTCALNCFLNFQFQSIQLLKKMFICLKLVFLAWIKAALSPFISVMHCLMPTPPSYYSFSYTIHLGEQSSFMTKTMKKEDCKIKFSITRWFIGLVLSFNMTW